MTAANRSAQFAKIHKILKKVYKVPAHASRSVIEHLLFAACLEGARHDAAEEAFAALVHTFFDWNEVRVTSVSELAEVMACLPDPRGAANRIKRVLHAVFEATFNFDLEDKRKKNLGPTVKWLEKLDGVSPFMAAYLIQHGLGGHSIPIDAGTMAALSVLDAVTDKDVKAGSVTGLERAIPKSKGIEFGALLHELGADYSANPYSPALRDTLRQINPDCEGRLPKRRAVRVPPKSQEADNDGKAAGAKQKPVAEKSGDKKKAAAPAPAAGTAKKKATAHPPASKAPPSEKTHSHGKTSKKRSATEGLSKRKPR